VRLIESPHGQLKTFLEAGGEAVAVRVGRYAAQGRAKVRQSASWVCKMPQIYNYMNKLDLYFLWCWYDAKCISMPVAKRAGPFRSIKI
jgi:hypothetical protein